MNFPIIQKPPFRAPCNRCGVCCQEEACGLSRSFMFSDAAPCIALEIEPNGEFSCGLYKHPSRYIVGLPAEEEQAVIEILKPLWTGICCSQAAEEKATEDAA